MVSGRLSEQQNLDTGLAFSSMGVDEGALLDTVVGVASAVDADGGASVTYSLVNNGNGAFTIDANTGQVTVADSTLVDFEGGDNFITVEAIGSSGGISHQTFLIDVTDINEAPSAIDFSGGVIDNGASGTIIGQAFAVDVDFSDTHTFSLTDDATGQFEIDSNTGEVRIATGVTLDLASNTTYDIIIQATDSGGLITQQGVTLNVAPQNSPSWTYIEGTAGFDNIFGTSIDEAILGYGGNDALYGSGGNDLLVGGLGNDSLNGQAGDDLYYFDANSGTDNIPYESPGETNVIIFDEEVSLDQLWITRSNYNLYIQVIGGDTSIYAQYALLNGRISSIVTKDGTLDASNIMALADIMAAETMPATVAGRSQTVVDAVNTYWTAEINEIPVIDPNASSGGGGTAPGPQVVPNRAPQVVSFSGVINENAAIGDIVGTVIATDYNPGDSLTFSLVDDAGGLFTIDAITGDVKVNASLDFEISSDYKITVRVSDNGGLTVDRSFPIFVTDAAESPNAINFVGSLDENTGALENIGIMIAHDDEGGPFTYSLESDPSGKFAIDPNTGVVSTTAIASFDYETTTGYDVTIKITDAQGNTYQEVVTLNVQNLNEPVIAVNFTGTNIDENVPAGTVVGTASAVDGDASDTHTFSITNDPSGFFTIDSATGVVTVASGADIDYETATSHDIIIRATDPGGLSKEQVFTINVNDINETNTPPTVNDNTYSIQENAPLNTPIGNLNATDPDDPTTPEGQLSYTIESGDPLGKFFIDTNGEIRVNGGLNFEVDPTTYNLIVTVTDNNGGANGLSDTAAITINVTDVNETPIANDKTVNNYVGPGWVTNLGASDPDGTPLTYNIVSETGFGVLSSWSITNGILYTTTQNGQALPKTSTLTIDITDGVFTVQQIVTVKWAPDEGPLLPVVLDMDGDGVELIDPQNSSIEFDANGDGFLDRIGWVAADDALLVLDRNGDGIVTNGAEISFVDDLPGAETDLEGLAAFDANSDGVLDAQDERFAEFLVWQDLNQNGFSEEAELKTLSDAGINSIDLTITPTGETIEGSSGNVVLNTAEFTLSDGTIQTVGDVALVYEDGAPGNSGGNRNDFSHGIPDFIAAQVAANTNSNGNENGNGVLPVVVDLDGDGIELIGVSDSTIFFDTDGDTLLERIGWVAADDGILAYDINGDGNVNPLEEITFTQYLDGAQTDLEGLTFFDTNGDLIFNSEDVEFSSFGIWQDFNQNGISDPGEFKSLEEAGILRINLDFEPDGTSSDGNTIHNKTSFTYTDFTGGLVGDVELGTKDTNLPQGIKNIIDELNNLPFGDNPRIQRTLERLQVRLEHLESRFNDWPGLNRFERIFGWLNFLRERLNLQDGRFDPEEGINAIQDNLQDILDWHGNFGFESADLNARYQNLIHAMGVFGAGRGVGDLDFQEHLNHHFENSLNLVPPNG